MSGAMATKRRASRRRCCEWHFSFGIDAGSWRDGKEPGPGAFKDKHAARRRRMQVRMGARRRSRTILPQRGLWCSYMNRAADTQDLVSI